MLPILRGINQATEFLAHSTLKTSELLHHKGNLPVLVFDSGFDFSKRIYAGVSEAQSRSGVPIQLFESSYMKY